MGKLQVTQAWLSVCLAILLAAVVLAGMALGAGSVRAQEATGNEAQADFVITSKVMLPLIRVPVAKLDRAVTTDVLGGSTNGFLPGEDLRYEVAIVNEKSQPVLADVSWVQEGDCDSTTTIYSSTVTLQPGTWLYRSNANAPLCRGVYTHTIKVDIADVTTKVTKNYVVMFPSTNLLSDQPAFDKCNAPSITNLKTWWEKSPYRAVNLYIGGISRYCDNLNLDAVWIDQASEMGWTFIPTWVGPQAPCTDYKYQMSSDSTVAYQQGKTEADAAAYTARRLGLLGERVIYLDLESYRYRVPTNTSCTLDQARSAVSAFVLGWTERLNALGLESGVYGSPGGTFLGDFYTLAAAPKYVWFTHWYTDTYDVDATVWYTWTATFTDTMWADHQRIKQYTNSHYETWGGVTMGIDSNIADGGVTGVVAPLEPPTDTITVTNQTAIDAALPIPTTQNVQSAAPTSSVGGYQVTDGRLLVTGNLGSDWADITPSQAQGRTVGGGIWEAGKAVFVEQVEPGPQGLRVWTTDNNGMQWSLANLPVHGGEFYSAAWLEPVSEAAAYLAIQVQTGSNFSQGLLFQTQDGGMTWSERSLPASGRIAFTGPEQGWLLGGADGEELYFTPDGGQSWERVALEAALQATHPADLRALGELLPEAFYPALPEGTIQVNWLDEHTAWAIVQEGTCQGDKLPRAGGKPFQCWMETRLLETRDGGESWAGMGD